MEQFINQGAKCVVLDRQGDSALVAILDNEYQPFVVAYGLSKGGTCWRHGHYFRELAPACMFWQEEVLDEPRSA